MDATSTEYEFLDLTDINEEERSSLTSALFAPAPAQPPAPPANWPQPDKTEGQTAWADPNYDSSCSGTPGPPTASSSLDSLPTTEREMAPHSPQRNAPSHAAAQPPAPPPPQLAYSQPPPPIYNPTPPNHWPQHLISPNVYVSQVTANVNVHGYMGQYYHSQYVPHQPPQEPRGRDGRDRTKGRRGGGVKRGQSPPATPYLYYHQYYPSPQTAQGAPLYHVPVYHHPMSYVTAGYPYMQLMDYGMMEDPNNPGEKGPEEYPPEMMIEQEHVPHEMFYPSHPACLPPGPLYDPNRQLDGPCSIEPYSQYYQFPQPPPTVHQFNVHAKNFVRQSENKNHNAPPQELKSQENQPTNKNHPQSSSAVDALPVKDLKISSGKPSTNIKQSHEKLPVANSQMAQKNATATNIDKTVPKPASDTPKSAWTSNNAKNADSVNKTAPVTVVSQPTAPVATQIPSVQVTNKPILSTPNVSQNKITKATTPAPFVNKPFVKSGPAPQVGAVILPQQGLPSKAPFSNKHKREMPAKNQEIVEQPEAVPSTTSTLPPAVELKQSLVPKPAVPVAIPIHNHTTASITTKAPFSQARKSSISSPETPAPVLPTPPQAPTPSDFPPPPASRRSIEQTSSSPVVAQPPPSGRTWASLFVSSTTVTGSQPDESVSIASVTTTAASTMTNANSNTNQRPVAKVGPFDASPLQNENHTDKSNLSAAAKLTNAISRVGNKDGSGDTGNSTMPSHIHDPSAYRMGEHLSKYQLNHHTVSLQPRGLCNRSNYCYINAILQALIACPPFYNMLKSLPYQLKKGKSSTPIIDAMVELCCEFSPLPPGARITRIERASRTSPAGNNGADNSDANSAATAPPVNVGTPFEPSTVLHMLRDMNNGDSFRVEGRQEDAEEFLGCLLNGLNDEMLELIKLIDPDDSKEVPIVNGNDPTPESEDDDEWKVMGPKNKGSIERRCLAGRTPLSDIFRGQLRSRLQRATDTTASDTTHCVQPFFTLPLDIERSNSVREALERVAGRDRLEGVTCPSRGRPVEAWQQVLLEQLPAVLLLHLKCFHSRPSDGATVKIVKTIDYPVELKIDPKIISPKMKYGTKQRSYKLFAVVYHEGAEAEKGHYLTDVYHVGCGGWLRYDDSVVTAVTEQQVLHPRTPRTPYLLLYRRQDTMQLVRHPQTS